MNNYHFTSIFIIAILLVLSSGCTTSFTDPIVGSWLSEYGMGGQMNLVFTNDGRFYMSNVGSGTWEKISDNRYQIEMTNTLLGPLSINTAVRYIPDSDTLDVDGKKFVREGSASYAKEIPNRQSSEISSGGTCPIESKGVFELNAPAGSYWKIQGPWGYFNQNWMPIDGTRSCVATDTCGVPYTVYIRGPNGTVKTFQVSSSVSASCYVVVNYG